MSRALVARWLRARAERSLAAPRLWGRRSLLLTGEILVVAKVGAAL